MFRIMYQYMSIVIQEYINVKQSSISFKKDAW